MNERFDINLAVKYGLINLVFGFVVGLINLVLASGSGFEIILAALPIANFFTSFFLWKFIIGKAKPSMIKIILTGVLSGIFNHYFCWLFISCISYAGFLINGSFKSSLGDIPISPIEMLSAGFTFSFVSLFLFGWLTITLSIIAGLLLQFLSKQK